MILTYFFNKQCYYQFITEAGSKYSISLENFSSWLGIPDTNTFRAMFFSVERKLRAKDGKDHGINKTIIAMALDYPEKYNDIVFYVHSNKKGQANTQRKLFFKWFKHYNPGQFAFEARTIKNEEYVFINNTHNKSAKHFLTWLDRKL